MQGGKIRMSGPKVSKAELDRMRQIEVQKKKQIMCEIKNSLQVFCFRFMIFIAYSIFITIFIY